MKIKFYAKFLNLEKELSKIATIKEKALVHNFTTSGGASEHLNGMATFIAVCSVIKESTCCLALF